MWEYLPIEKGNLLKDKDGVFCWAARVASISHYNGKLSYSILVEYSRNGRWYDNTKIIDHDELSVWRNNRWIELKEI